MNSPMRQRIVDKYGEGILNRSVLSIRGGAGVIESILKGANCGTAVEIGTYKGVGAAELSQYCKRVITFDLKHGKLENAGQTFDRLAFWESLGINNIDLVLVEDDAEKAMILSHMEFDFAVIDGAHDAISKVAFDFDAVKKCGSVLFHDYDRDWIPRKDCVCDFVDSLPKHQIKVLDIFAWWRDG